MTAEKDPATPAFWDELFRKQHTPWDAGSAPLELERYLADERGGGRILIPGCGSGYEILSFAGKGYEVVAIDFSQAAVERAKACAGPFHVDVLLGDFFSHDLGARPFDLVYERAFLAALPPTMRSEYALRVAQLLRPGGSLIGYFVYGEQQGGPPYCLEPEELQELLGETFDRTAVSAVARSVPTFEGRERWEVWVRKG
jgi:SAM-dependent methyltransferase